MHISILYRLMSDVSFCHAIKQSSSVTSWPWLDHQYIYIYISHEQTYVNVLEILLEHVTYERGCTFFGEYEWFLSFRYTSREAENDYNDQYEKKKQYKKYIHQPLKFNLNRPSYELYPPWKFWWFQVVDFYKPPELVGEHHFYLGKLHRNPGFCRWAQRVLQGNGYGFA